MFEICPCCGTEFGYHDIRGIHWPEELRRVHLDLRGKWIAAGMQWYSSVQREPDGWNPHSQLVAAGMELEAPLPSGTLVAASVVEHHRWGVVIRLLPPAPDVTGVIDVLSVTNERPYQPIDDYPRIGSQVQAVVMGYTPNGQLRLSTRSSDVDPVLEAEEPNE